MNGIFRDVYLLKRPEKAIRDYRIKTTVEDTKAIVDLSVEYVAGVDTKITLEDASGAVVARGELAETGEIKLEVVAPTLWNTENPYLYTLRLLDSMQKMFTLENLVDLWTRWLVLLEIWFTLILHILKSQWLKRLSLI